MRTDPREIAAVFVGGFLGAIARVGLADAVPADAGQWPWATFVANVGGALALGYVGARLHGLRPVPDVRLRFVGTGLCGALTTFSTMQLELLRMLDGERYGLAAGYALAGIAAGVAAVALATALARRIGSAA